MRRLVARFRLIDRCGIATNIVIWMPTIHWSGQREQ